MAQSPNCRSPLRPSDRRGAGWDLGWTMTRSSSSTTLDPRLRLRRRHGPCARRRHARLRPRHVHRRDGARRAPASRRCCSPRPGSTARLRARVHLGEVELCALSERALARLRRERLGFVFQSFNLLARADRGAERRAAVAARRAASCRASRWRRRSPRSASATARATARRSSRAASSSAWRSPARWSASPSSLFADEPTGALDLRAGREVLALLRDTVDRGGRTLVMVTHDPSAAA